MIFLRVILINILIVHTLYAQDTATSENLAPTDGYKIFRGKIGTYPITMYITDFGRYYQGYYYYNKYHIPKYVTSPIRPVQESKPTFTLYEVQKKYFKGELINNVYKGIWNDSFKTLPFLLTEDYHKGEIRLMPYCYFFTLNKPNRNRFYVALDMYLADTVHMPSRKAAELNKLLLEMLNEQPGTSAEKVFKHFKRMTLDTISEDIFKGLDRTHFNVEQLMVETHNEKGILCIVMHASYNPKIGILHRQRRYLIYDSKKNRRITQKDIFKCSDSTLRSLIVEKFRESSTEQQIEEMIGSFNKFYTGELTLDEEGMFCFNFQKLSDNWCYSARIPFKALKKYVRPRYRKRLIY